MQTDLLREKILELAFRGKLVKQDSSDVPIALGLEQSQTSPNHITNRLYSKCMRTNTSDKAHYQQIKFMYCSDKIKRLLYTFKPCIMVTKFKKHLTKSNLAANTITSYMWTIKNFLSKYGDVRKENLLAYKGFLVEHYKPQTVNLRLQAINKYLEFVHQEHLKLKFVKIQQKNFLENVISDADYKFLKTKLKSEGFYNWYFLVWFMAATGARISELLQIKAEHIAIGFFDMYGKGGKLRRLYIPKRLKVETLKWLSLKGIHSGYLFLNRFGQRITTRGVSQQLKHFASRYGLNTKVVHPHSFRHRYAKNFLERFNDIALLADLMGHESIETTRIYLRRTATEQQQLVDKIVNW